MLEKENISVCNIPSGWFGRCFGAAERAALNVRDQEATRSAP
jgi:hypothetical protein